MIWHQSKLRSTGMAISSMNEPRDGVPVSFDPRRGWQPLVALALLWGGIRFSDGGALLAIARGDSPYAAHFKTVVTRYVWDSPLKVLLLKSLMPNIIVIAIVFAVLAALPLLPAFSRRLKLAWLAIAADTLTPAWKLSIENVGVGDGLTIVLVILAVAATNAGVVAAAFLTIGLWHPQQSFFLAISYLVGRHCYAGKVTRRDAVSVLAPLGVAAAVFGLHKLALGWYGGRVDYLSVVFDEYLARNLVYAPIAFFPVALWFAVLAPPARHKVQLAAWLGVLGFISLLTTDVSRVMTLISLPIVLFSARKLLDEGGPPGPVKFWACGVAIALFPLYSWSGLDYLLWDDLLRDMCKWHVHCF